MKLLRILPMTCGACIAALLLIQIWPAQPSATSELPTLARSLALSGAAPVSQPTGLPPEFADGIQAGEFVVLDEMDAGAIRAALLELEKVPVTSPNGVWSEPGLLAVPALAGRWMEIDAAGCLDWLFARPPGPFRRMLADSVIPDWLHSAGKRAVDEFTRRTGHRPRAVDADQKLREQWGDIAYNLKDADYRTPEAILADIRALSPADLESSNHENTHSRLLREWEAATSGRNAGARGLELLQTITDEEGNPLADWAENCKPFLLHNLLPAAPADVMKWLSAHPRSAWGSGLVEEALSGLLNPNAADPFERTLSPRDAGLWPSVGESVEWFLSVPRPPGEVPAMAALIRVWSAADLNAAGEWLNHQPESADKDAARAAMATAAVLHEADAANRWVDAIQDPASREAARAKVAEIRREYDPGNAQTPLQ